MWTFFPLLSSPLPRKIRVVGVQPVRKATRLVLWTDEDGREADNDEQMASTENSLSVVEIVMRVFTASRYFRFLAGRLVHVTRSPIGIGHHLSFRTKQRNLFPGHI